MANILQFKCRICKASMDHELIKEFDNLPHGVSVIKCLGCGALGVERWADDADA
jgi:hypothetical protein